MRIQGVALEHHGDVPILGGEVVDEPVADVDLAGTDAFEAGDHPQHRRLAATRGPHENGKFLVRNIDGQVVNDLDRAELLEHILQGHTGHGADLFDCNPQTQGRAAAFALGVDGRAARRLRVFPISWNGRRASLRAPPSTNPAVPLGIPPKSVTMNVTLEATDTALSDFAHAVASDAVSVTLDGFVQKYGNGIATTGKK